MRLNLLTESATGYAATNWQKTETSALTAIGSSEKLLAARPLTLILGAPRSGTTWLAKIFDSHPSVLYRHEPDMARRKAPIPVFYPDADRPRHATAIREQMAEFIQVRALKSAGSIPVFRKSYDHHLTYAARLASVYSLRLADIAIGSAVRKYLNVPDWGRAQSNTNLHVVIKSVSAAHHAGLLAHAIPHARIVLILRNPLAQVASRINGIKTGQFEMKGIDFDRRLLALPQAKAYNIDEQALSAMSLAERLAWEWAISNERAIDELAGNPRSFVLRYVDLANDPLSVSRKLFDFAGLPWAHETEAFIAKSTTREGRGYYTVLKDGRGNNESWRTILSEQEITAIANIMRASKCGSVT